LRPFPLAPLLLLALAACTQPPPPNVLLVTLDTTRADHLGPYAAGAAATPELDAFARGAVVYERAYATSSWTLPSHASIFTGLLPIEHGAQTAPQGQSATLGYGVRPLAEHFDTLAERLAARGYHTAAVVSGPALKRELGVAQGFERYEDDLGGPRALTGRRAGETADRAIALLQHLGAGPWFLFVNFFDPHAPYRPPHPYDAGLPEVDTGPITAALVQRLVAGAPAAPPAPWEHKALDGMRAGYDAEIAYMDRNLGRLLRAVARGPRGGDTLVVITADHGESFGEHDYLSHGANLYEEAIHVPLLVRWPDGRGAGTREGAPVQNQHLFATILRAAGAPVPPGAPGLDAPTAEMLTEVGASDANVRLFGPFFDRRLRALRVGDRKLIESSRGQVELYDVARDPAELHDLAAAEPDAVADLRQRLERFCAAHPPLYDPDARAELAPETQRALRELGYIE
jgi:arylsulfatase A-like enzyme